MKKLLLIGTILVAVGCGCAPRRDEICPSSTLAMCEPAIYFEYDSAKIDDKNAVTIDWIAQKLNTYPDRTVTLAGYTDLNGRENYNLSLSGRRAAAIQEALILRGVDPNQIIVEAKGMTDPLATEEDKQNLNRRVDVTFGHKQRSLADACKETWDELFCSKEAVKEEADKAQQDASATAEEVKEEAKATVAEVKKDANDAKADIKNDVKEIKKDVKEDVKNVKEDVKNDVNDIQPNKEGK
ncbi:MAG: OmpA family protein [Alphaproteobacteria bacterium]|nr:OmpA family protein [Alphaproteobacteria bacterium]